jgi:hypothetical protein
MLSLSTRLLIGFGAGALSHLVFQGGLGAVYHAAGLIPGQLWSLDMVPPLGVPKSANLAFWAGLWGVLYAALQPRLTARLGLLWSGVSIGLAALLCRWLIVLPLKGEAIAEGFDPQSMLVFIGLHLVFGLGLAVIFDGLRQTVSRRAASDKSEQNLHQSKG